MEYLPIFVYGTLQRGQLRASCWPRTPQLVRIATVYGTLYDLGPHPALIPGPSRVLGELWEIDRPHLAETLRVLDKIEGFCQPHEDDWYRRDVVACWPQGGPECRAYAYLYARPQELDGTPVVEPDDTGVCQWRRL